MTDDEELNINEWLFGEYVRIKDALADLAHRHEDILSRLTLVCRRNDQMQAAGDRLVELLNYYSDPEDELVTNAMIAWGDANV